MLIGYARVSKADGSQSLDLQRDALRTVGVDRRPPRDSAAAYACSGRATCSSSGSSPASGRNLAHLVNTMQDLCHDQSLLPLDFVRGGLFMETELGYDTRVVVGWGGACSARPFTFFCASGWLDLRPGAHL